MTLPAYAEQLRRFVDECTACRSDVGNLVAVFTHVELHLDRILRDAEIAKAAREYAIAEGAAATAATIERMLALIAKETP